MSFSIQVLEAIQITTMHNTTKRATPIHPEYSDKTRLG
jgi:hypothetical protein